MKSFQEFLITEKVDNDYKYKQGTRPVKTGKGHSVVGHTWTGPDKDKKGANIIQHKDTKKFFAGGGSKTNETDKQFDTPEEAAAAYHGKK